MKRKIFLFLIMIGAMFMIGSVQAEEINKFYADANQNVRVADKVIGDSALAGALIDIDSKIEGIGFIAGQSVNINGDLDYGFIAGQSIKVNGEIYRNIYMAGSTIDFTDNSSVGRDTKIVGDSITLAGKFGRDVLVSGNKVIISDKTYIDRDITIVADQIDILDDVSINGTLKYNENAKVNIHESSSIKNIEKTKEVKEESSFSFKDLILSMVNLIVVILILAILLPKAFNKTDDLYEDKNFNFYAKSFAIGLLFIICTPIVSLILLASNIGTILGLILLAIYIITLYIAYGFASYVLGNLIFNRVFKLNINRYLVIIIGIILIKLLVLIPVVGGLISLITISIGMNTLWELVKDNSGDSVEDTKEVKVVEKSKSDMIKEKTKINSNDSKKNSTQRKNSNSKKNTDKKTNKK